MTEEVPLWIMTKKGNLYILSEHYGMRRKAFGLSLLSHQLSVAKHGKEVVLGDLVRVDMSPEALLEDLDIREGQRLLLLPAGSGVAG